MSERATYKVLFLCTGNSARSIFAEYLLRRKDRDRFEVFSAGAQPTGQVNPFAIKVLTENYGIDASGARSKAWEEFGNLKFDFVITVCDNARESCPIWPGQPIIAHWGLPDPALAEGSDEEKLRQFQRAAQTLDYRIGLFCSLPLEKLDRLRLVKATNEIGEQH
ncbi:MAG TPA: arsenate reductase ArsC [Pyrinomonadaceae bacterium]|jgi:protein-tyrosine-phosphatase|nr:arsenate reductase ArsC [Pyrinomonadaceae bacterium]